MEWLFIIGFLALSVWVFKSKPAAPAKTKRAAEEPLQKKDFGLSAAAIEKSHKERTQHPGYHLRIEYADANGEITTRNIRALRTVEGERAVMIEAYCELRQDRRTFRTDRVLQAWDIPTGKKIPDVTAWAFSAMAPQDRFDREHDQTIRYAAPAVTLLVWIVSADRKGPEKNLWLILDMIDALRENIPASPKPSRFDREKAVDDILEKKVLLDQAKLAASLIDPHSMGILRAYAQKACESGSPAMRKRYDRFLW